MAPCGRSRLPAACTPRHSPLAERRHRSQARGWCRQINCRGCRSPAWPPPKVLNLYEDRELVVLARFVEGCILLKQGSVPEGMALLDEAMLAAIRGRLPPMWRSERSTAT